MTWNRHLAFSAIRLRVADVAKHKSLVFPELERTTTLTRRGTWSGGAQCWVAELIRTCLSDFLRYFEKAYTKIVACHELYVRVRRIR